MVFAKGKDVNVTDNDHLFVILCENRIIDDVFTPCPMISTVYESIG